MNTTIEKLATGLAGAGLLASGIVHAMALLGANAPPAAIAYAMFAGAGLSQLLAMTIAPRPATPEPWTRKQLREAVLDAVPFEMRAGVYALIGYTFVQFALLAVSFEPATLGELLMSARGLRFFSSGLLALYFSALTACTAARRTRSSRPLR